MKRHHLQRGRDRNRKPRILFAVTTDLSLGLLDGFPDHMAAQGWEVHVAAGPGPKFTAARAKAGNVSFHAVPMSREPRVFSDVRALIMVFRLLKRVRPTVVSAGTPKAGLLYAVAGRLAGVPVRVYHQRGLRLETTKGLARKFLWALEKCAIACSSCVLCVSPSLRGVLVAERLVEPTKAVVIGAGSSNGVDLGRFNDEDDARDLRSGLGLGPSDRFVVGFVGRVSTDKGFDVLAAALRRLIAQGGRPSLLVIGNVEDRSAEAELEALAGEGIAVVATGEVSDVAPYYRTMSVHCLPTRREGFPNVVLEASAARIPTITTRATGAVDSVVDGVTGLLVPVAEPEALADALAKLAADDELRRRLGHAAHARVESHFSRIEVWKGLEAFYDRLLSAQGAAP